MKKETTIKILKGCGWGVLAIVLLFVLVMAIASPVAKYMINHNGEKWIGRQMHVEHVFVNPFTGGVTLKGFECKEQDGETNFVTFDKLYVRVAYPQMLFKRLTVRTAQLDGFNGQVLKKDDRFNFTDIIEFLSKEEEKDEEPSKWKITLNDIQIRNSSVHYHDFDTGKQWTLKEIALTIPGLYFDNQTTNAGIEFGLTTGGRVGIDADYQMESNRYKIQIALHDVHSDAVLPIVQDYLNVNSLGATMNANLNVEGNLDVITDMQVSGRMQMKGLSVCDTQNEQVLAFDEMRIAIKQANLQAQTIKLDTLAITGLTGTYEEHGDWNTVSRLMKKEETKDETVVDAAPVGLLVLVEDESEVKEEPTPWTISAKVLNVNGKNLTYRDCSMATPWEYSIRTMQVSGQNFSTTGNSTITMEATLPSDGTIKADYSGGLDVKKHDGHLNLHVRGVQLKDFDGFCRNYTGYPIEGGVLLIDSKLDVVNGQLNGNNRIEIDHPRVGKKVRGVKPPKKLPIRLCVKTLTSAKDMIIVDVPVSGDVTNPTFNFKKVLNRALLKVFFGPLMGLKDRDNSISEEELREMQAVLELENELLSDDTMR